jgi:hypothetical protein
MREKTLIALLGTAGAFAFACSSHTFSSSSRDGGADGGGSNTGGLPGAGGASGSAGSLQTGGTTSAGGARTTGGASGTGATGGATGGANGTGASPGTGGLGSTGGRQGTGGAANDSGISPDGGEVLDAGAVRCTGANPTFPTIDKGCSTSADCVVVHHTTSCCGSAILMAINHGDLARFQAAESICDAQYPACGCASFGVDVEDGTVLAPGSENLVVASCDNMVCRSHYSGKTFACGTQTCTDQQSCTESSGGPAGTPTSYYCNSLGNCKSCACVSPSVTAGCTCSDSQGFVMIACQRS